ncbi:uncharacterized protein [Rutidosis leptorrhynchoides]|uniref:uncharacterized protein n=1 Tax=Rutidosis leptorrhynchoides TaxID=125765 RepID=UPI003A9996E7
MMNTKKLARTKKITREYNVVISNIAIVPFICLIYFNSNIADIWIGSFHLYVEVAKSPKPSVPVVKQAAKTPPVINEQANSEPKTPPIHVHDEASYASKLSGYKDYNSKKLILEDADLVSFKKDDRILLLKLKNFDSLFSIYRLIIAEGFVDVKVQYLGGYWIWIQFDSDVSFNAFRGNSNLLQLFSCVKEATDTFIVDDRIVWIEISGIPSCAWGTSAFRKEVGSWLFDINDTIETESENTKPESAHDSVDSTSSADSEEHYDHLKEFEGVHIDPFDNNASTQSRPHDPVVNEVVSESDSHAPGFTKFKGVYNTNYIGGLNCNTSFTVDDFGNRSSQFDYLRVGFDNCSNVGDLLGLNLNGNKLDGVCFLALQESKMTRLQLFRLKSMWGNNHFDYALSLARGFSRGIISMWDPHSFVKENVWCFNHYVIVKGLWVRENIEVYMINVYAPQHLSDKVNVWNAITNFMASNSGDYILFRDWNSVCEESERCGTEVSARDAHMFNDFIEISSLHEVVLGGLQYTCRLKDGSKFSKLDRFFVTNNIMTSLEDIKGEVLPRGFSDHSPIMLFQDKIDYGPTYFKVFDSWFERGYFDSKVRDEWNTINSCPNKDIIAKIRTLKHSLKSWIYHSRCIEFIRLLDLKQSIIDLDSIIDTGTATAAEIESRNMLFKEQEDLTRIMSLDALQNSRVKWDVEGDENSKFFHCSLKRKRKQQHINGLMINGSWVTDPITNQSAVNFDPVNTIRSLTAADIALLEADFEGEEIKKAVWDCGSSKAPGPEGYSFRFIKHFWDILQVDIIRDVKNFFSSGVMPIGANSAFFFSLPEVRTSVLVNGNPTREFTIKRGLRQGDPLSPFLFIIVMEGLHIAFQRAMDMDFVRGIKVGNPCVRLSHFFYADDVIILSDWSREQFDNILCLLHAFHMVSGLNINVSKSHIFGMGVGDAEIDVFANDSGCLRGSFPTTYLGVPIGSNMKRKSSWSTLIDKFHSKMASWKVNLLSSGGRLTLIKSVMGSLGIYWMSMFKCPESILKHLESIRSQFFWGSSSNNKKMAWAKWILILASFEKGGLNVGSLKAFNLAMLYKWRWRYLTNPNDFWVILVKSIHGNVFENTLGNSLWSSIVECCSKTIADKLLPGDVLKMRVGNGRNISFWHDVWMGQDNLANRFNRLYHLELNKHHTIADKLVTGSWDWSWSRSNLTGRSVDLLQSMQAEVRDVQLSEAEDIWSCSITTDNIFSVKVARLHMDRIILPSSPLPMRWNKFIPKKVNIFMWRFIHDYLPLCWNLSTRGLDINTIICPVCNNGVEDHLHLFFDCSVALDVWRKVRLWTDCNMPSFNSWDDFKGWIELVNLDSNPKSRIEVIVAKLLWALWRFQNGIVFNEPLCNRARRQVIESKLDYMIRIQFQCNEMNIVLMFEGPYD